MTGSHNKSAYDKTPFIAVPAPATACVQGWDAIAERLRAAAAAFPRRLIVTVECYTGVDEPEVLAQLKLRLSPALVIAARDGMLPSQHIDSLVAPFLGGDDPVFGFLCGLV